jgi:hypothetical protein
LDGEVGSPRLKFRLRTLVMADFDQVLSVGDKPLVQLPSGAKYEPQIGGLGGPRFEPTGSRLAQAVS